MFENENNRFNYSEGQQNLNQISEFDGNGWSTNPADDREYNAYTASVQPETGYSDKTSQIPEQQLYQDNGWQPAQEQVYPYPVYQYPVVSAQPPKKKKSRRMAGFAVLAAFTIVLSGTVGFAGAYLGNQYANQTGTASNGEKVIYQAVQRTSSNSSTDKSGPLTVAEVASLVSSSVVEIRTESVTTGQFMQQYVSEGAGSGVIITSDGYIVTNNHVIEGASKITVTLKDGKDYNASLVGRDAKTDIAVLKIDATNLNAAVYGDSSKLVVGEPAIAVGNPLGELGGTVTSGIISALDRQISIDGETMTLLQTNAAINPGNSGGGLFNEYGELIGIVNAKSSGSDIEGLGFAIPINTAKTVIEELMENGYVSGRISLGLTIVDISDTQTAMAYRVSKTGVYISKVNDPASGFQSGDRIVSFQGVSIDNAEMLTNELNKCKVGDTVEIVVERRNQRYTISLTLQEEKPE